MTHPTSAECPAHPIAGSNSPARQSWAHQGLCADVSSQNFPGRATGWGFFRETVNSWALNKRQIPCFCGHLESQESERQAANIRDFCGVA